MSGYVIITSCDIIQCHVIHRTLQATSHLLPPPPLLGGMSTVTEWLEALQLSQLSNKFEGLTLQKISRMWDIELTSVSLLNIVIFSLQTRSLSCSTLFSPTILILTPLCLTLSPLLITEFNPLVSRWWGWSC